MLDTVRHTLSHTHTHHAYLLDKCLEGLDNDLAVFGCPVPQAIESNTGAIFSVEDAHHCLSHGLHHLLCVCVCVCVCVWRGGVAMAGESKGAFTVLAVVSQCWKKSSRALCTMLCFVEPLRGRKEHVKPLKPAPQHTLLQERGERLLQVFQDGRPLSRMALQSASQVSWFLRYRRLLLLVVVMAIEGRRGRHTEHKLGTVKLPNQRCPLRCVGVIVVSSFHDFRCFFVSNEPPHVVIQR